MVNSHEFIPILGPTEEGGEHDPLSLAYEVHPGQVVNIERTPRPESSYMQTAIIEDVVQRTAKIVPLPPRSKHVEAPRISA